MSTQQDDGQELLLGMDRVSAETQQWTLTRVDLVNWGTISGAASIHLDGQPTLIVGATGSGKSTILDAWSAVMQNPSTAMNAASNDSGGARGAGARNALTYVRGKTGDLPGAQSQSRYLRTGPTWSAIGLVYTSTGASTYTVGRLMFARADTERPSDLTNRWFAYRGDLPVRDLAEFATTTAPFHIGRIRERLPDLVIDKHWQPVAEDHFLLVLGIGREGDGRSALSMLHDIQRGAPIGTINELFATRVMARPTTFSRFDKGIAEFDHLIATHETFTTIADKIAVLGPIREAKVRLDAAEATVTQVGGYGDLSAPDSPYALWQADTWVDVLDEAVERCSRVRPRLEEQLEQASARAAALHEEYLDLDARYREGGGDRLQSLEAERRALVDALEAVRRHRDMVAAEASALGSLPATSEEWTAAVAAADDVLAEASDLEPVLTARAYESAARVATATAAVDEARTALDRARARRSNLPESLVTARDTLARAAGMTPEDLPFVAELVDVAHGQDIWRVAADAVLGGFARTVLVPSDRRAEFNRAIDSARVRTRVQLHSAPQQVVRPDELESTAPEGTLAARLVVDPDSAFAAWVRARVDERFAHECVEGADELLDDGIARVTRTGQERRGDRGAHGGHGNPIIGFSNTQRVRVLEAELAEKEALVPAARAAADEAAAAAQALTARCAAARALGRWQWRDLDEPSALQALAENEAEAEQLRRGDDELAALAERRDLKKAALNGARQAEGVAQAELRQLEAEIEQLYARKEPHLSRRETLQRSGVSVAAHQKAALDARLDADGPDSRTPAVLDAALRRITAALGTSDDDARKDVVRARAVLVGAFEDYQRRWRDPELGEGVDAYPDYEAVLTSLEASGVQHTRHEWARKVVEWAGQHAVQMNGEIDEADHQIQDRLAPVQKVLSAVPFSARGTRLRLSAKYTPSAEVQDFRAALRRLTSNVTVVPTDERAALDHAEERFRQFATLLDRVRTRVGEVDNTARRTRLLDVRLHHSFEAVEVDQDGNDTYVYRHTGGKSGGETQEIIAFISGAALRYMVGDDHQTRPRFAPVLLDEAFTKADAATAGRGVSAFLRLGFQPIVVAPEHSFSALQGYFTRVQQVAKQVDTDHTFVVHALAPGDDSPALRTGLVAPVPTRSEQVDGA